MTDFKGKKVLVFGAGKSGIGSSRLLHDLGARVVLYDGSKKIDPETTRQRLGCGGVELALGCGTEEIPFAPELVVLSPGVPCDIEAVKSFYAGGIPVWSEVELAWQAGQGKVLAITGTNGKTTTTALLGKIMSDARDSVFVVGNIGTAYTSKALETKAESIVVAEISSFQLETIDTFAPSVSAILNITPDHLDRHHTMEEYIRVKESITRNQTSKDVCVLNYEDEELRRFGQTLLPGVVWFSSERSLEEGIYLEGEEIILAEGGKKTCVLKTSQLNILGKHNYENAMAAIAMAYKSGVPLDSIRKSAMEFTAVPHRIEYAGEKKGVVYYNDSKGTNPDAAIKGIQAMTRPTLLIGGGYDKHSDYTDWIKAFDGKVRCLVLIGQTREKIRQTALECGFRDVVLCEDLKEAVSFCAAKALPGDAVLLSPACASWGQFDNYEQRGDRFKEYVKALPDE
ncbi:MAG: UDP-N-acetylmuramoyl-L-alanine--D-glutamate ligase [Blautia sp.]|nr:UDP-N-acetylmuramoyl-L-alanine--D-glutamate ligase [Blautia sp.]